MNDRQKLSSHFSAAATPHPSDIYIETPRLILRETRPDDIGAFRDTISQPDFKYYCFDGTEEKLVEFMDDSIKTQTPDPKTGLRDKFMLAFTLKDTDEVIGHASLLKITEYDLAKYVPSAEDIDYEAAYFMNFRHGGQAYAQEALLNLMHYGFSQLGLPGLGSMQDLENAQAIAVAAKTLGFKKVGECIGITTEGARPHQVCIVTPDNFYALRKNDKRQYIYPHELAGRVPSIDSGAPAP